MTKIMIMLILLIMKMILIKIIIMISKWRKRRVIQTILLS